MYVNHSMGVSCPIHGDPKTPRRRIRYYIGIDPTAQAHADKAISNAAELARHETTLKTLRLALRRAVSALTEAQSYLFRAL